MFARILVPLDGSETAAQAVPVASEVARRFSGGLVLVEVISQLLEWHRSLRPPTDAAGAADLEECAVHAARTRLGRIAAALRGLPVEVDVRLGRPTEAILEAAADHGCTLICLAAGEPRHVRPTTGSPDRHHSIHCPCTLAGVSERLVHASPVPVLLVRTPLPQEAPSLFAAPGPAWAPGG
jgi:nucleotide-binding universal stress UspA family protein